MSTVDMLVYLIENEVLTLDRVAEKYRADVEEALGIGGKD